MTLCSPQFGHITFRHAAEGEVFTKGFSYLRSDDLFNLDLPVGGFFYLQSRGKGGIFFAIQHFYYVGGGNS